jgi:aspartate 4-decarboxylase
MPTTIPKIKTSRHTEQTLETLSPFELKNKLIALAKERDQSSSLSMLNAGRGNPNWVATTPRDAFFTLGQFAMEECKRVEKTPEGLGGYPEKKGVAKRFEQFLNTNKHAIGMDLLTAAYKYGVEKKKFDKDAWVYELTESIVGCMYPEPDRMLKHVEAVVHDYLMQEMCDNKPPKGKYDLFAVEGGTAAMCYIFDSLMQNGLLSRGDKVAMMVPTFTPYLEIAELDRYKFKLVEIHASEVRKDGTHTWQYPESELEKLTDRSVKALFVVNPSNPPSVAIQPGSLKRLIQIVKNMNPNLMIVTDDVYGTFVPGFRSLMAELPHNTIGVYSFSKYFGCTGWRLGVIAIHEDNIYDKMISALPDKDKKMLQHRYSSLSLHPEKIKFIDRMVADSRQVALNHTAGLSMPQQIQMALFALFALLDKQNKYKKLTQQVVQQRLKLLWDGVQQPLPADALRAGYYSELDVLVAARNEFGEDFVKWVKKNFEPVDILFRLAEKTAIVLLNGGGFDGPEWSVRVSLANLPTESYALIGKSLREIGMEYVKAWQQSKISGNGHSNGKKK